MIGFIDTSLQIQSVIPAHNQWLFNTRSIPYWTTSVFASTVTDFVLIYRSVTSTASVVRWLTFHSWRRTLLRMTNAKRIANKLSWFFYNFDANRMSHSVLQFLSYSVFLCLSVAAGTYLPNRCQAMDYSASIRCSWNVLTEPLPSTCHNRSSIHMHICGSKLLEQLIILNLTFHVAKSVLSGGGGGPFR
jgi:hypothetical protein